MPYTQTTTTTEGSTASATSYVDSVGHERLSVSPGYGEDEIAKTSQFDARGQLTRSSNPYPLYGDPSAYASSA